MNNFNDDDNYVYYLVSQNIKKYRKLKGYSQKKLAQIAHYSEGFIMNIESENYFQTFSLSTVSHFARVLGIDIRQLFDPIEEENQEKEKVNEN